MRLTFSQRVEIEKGIKSKISIRKIAKELGIAASTIHMSKLQLAKQSRNKSISEVLFLNTINSKKSNQGKKC